MFLLVTATATATATATTLCAGPLRVLRVVLQSATTSPWGWASGGVCLPDGRLWTPGFQSVVGGHCLQIWPAAVFQVLPLTTGSEEEAEGLNSGDSFSWHAGVVTFLPLMYDLGLA